MSSPGIEILDTNLLIWAVNEPERLPKKFGARLQTERNFYFSLVSIWEVSIKASLQKLDFQIDIGEFYLELLKLGFQELPITFKHLQASAQLPLIHRDPFDRLLVATAKAESSGKLLTADKTLAAYGDFVILAK